MLFPNSTIRAWVLTLIFAWVVPVQVYAKDMSQTNFTPCPNKPNCVSSLSTDTAHAIEPLKYVDELAVIKQALIRIIKQQPRTKILTEENTYIHSTFTSFVFRFVDDVEFVFDDEHKQIHVRSASRTGRSDFGVNRERIELLRQLLIKDRKVE